MKTIQHLIFLSFLTQSSSCQQVHEKDYEIKVEIVDDSASPVPSAIVNATRKELIKDSPVPLTKNITVEAPSDASGIALLKFKSIPSPEGVAIHKNDYYSSFYSVKWTSPEGPGNMQKVEIKAVLKPMKKPIPMIVHRSCGFILEDMGRAYGFDLEVGEAVAPHGKGKVADIEIILNGSRKDNGLEEHEDIDFKASLRFLNPLDGLVEFPVEPKDRARGSSYMSAYEAPTDGYVNQIDRHGVWGKARGTSQYWKYWHDLEEKGYYFRVRTHLDDSGRIISCYYGKIYGALRLIPTRKRMQNFQATGEAALTMSEVYFNSTPNDKNVECDTKVNLLKKTDEYGKPFLIDRP